MARRRPKKTTRVAAPSPRASLGRRTVYGRTEQRRPPVWKRYETKVIMVWGSVLIAAAALKKSTRAWLAQGVNLKFWGYAGMPAPSDLCPMYTLQGDTPESCAPSFVGMPPPPPPPDLCPMHNLQINIPESCAPLYVAMPAPSDLCAWPLQDILSFLGFCARINHP